LEKVACGAFSDSGFVVAGKRLLLRILRSQHSHIPVQQRDFCRLPRACYGIVLLTTFDWLLSAPLAE
jgi:hypothetical protein